MEYVQTREELITAVKIPFAAAFPGVALVFDNAPFDWNNPPERYVCFEIEEVDGGPIGMRAQPKTRTSGFVYVEAHIKLGLGSKWCAQIRDWFAETLQYKTFGRAQVQEAKSDGKTETKGYYIESLKLPYYVDPA